MRSRSEINTGCRDGGVKRAFLRHGQTEWNREGRMQGTSDIPLNDTGRAQAREAAEHLGHGDWDEIVSSPLVRARETAEIVAAELGLELGPAYPEFVERAEDPAREEARVVDVGPLGRHERVPAQLDLGRSGLFERRRLHARGPGLRCVASEGSEGL